MKILTKLTSRKFLTALSAIITGIALIASGSTVEGTATVISAVIAYIAAEGIIDAKFAGSIAKGVSENLNGGEAK